MLFYIHMLHSFINLTLTAKVYTFTPFLCLQYQVFYCIVLATSFSVFLYVCTYVRMYYDSVSKTADGV